MGNWMQDFFQLLGAGMMGAGMMGAGVLLATLGAWIYFGSK